MNRPDEMIFGYVSLVSDVHVSVSHVVNEHLKGNIFSYCECMSRISVSLMAWLMAVVLCRVYKPSSFPRGLESRPGQGPCILGQEDRRDSGLSKRH